MQTTSLLESSITYDYIITGMGCAGLSLAMHMIESGKFQNKKILLLDKEIKNQNDRTWCFWETEPGLFEKIVYKKWDRLWFHQNKFSRLLQIKPYQYKLIRGKDFYRYCLETIQQHPNFEIKTAEVISIENREGKALVNFAGGSLSAEYVFNSILFEKPELKSNEYYLLQHFKGWTIETEKPSFNPGEATLMDFRVGQQYGTSFVYVMPFSETKALVEYTLFTKDLLKQEEYKAALREYIKTFLRIDSYKILEEEFGIIPMTNYKFPPVNGHIVNIGTAGGQTKGSSGYTFRFIQKHSVRIVESLIKKKNPFIARPAGPRRFHFYDSTLLHILANNKLPGDEVFARLFKKNKPQQVLRFLDNESSIADELKIISSLPTLPFLKAAWKQRK